MASLADAWIKTKLPEIVERETGPFVVILSGSNSQTTLGNELRKGGLHVHNFLLKEDGTFTHNPEEHPDTDFHPPIMREDELKLIAELHRLKGVSAVILKPGNEHGAMAFALMDCIPQIHAINPDIKIIAVSGQFDFVAAKGIAAGVHAMQQVMQEGIVFAGKGNRVALAEGLDALVDNPEYIETALEVLETEVRLKAESAWKTQFPTPLTTGP